MCGARVLCMAAAEINESIVVEVAYALPERQALLPLQVAKGTSAREAIEQSGILELFPDIDLDQHRIGVFGRLCTPDRVLESGDRVEIYRPLLADPKEVRRRLAAEGRSMGQSKERKD